ncbi:MAG: carboxypeptidase Q, partial [Planctomycetota bacterium]
MISMRFTANRLDSIFRTVASFTLVMGLMPVSLAYQEEAPSDGAPEAIVAAAEITDDPGLIRLIEEARVIDGAQRNIEVLTRYFPRRLTGSELLKLAQDWAIGAFEDWGVEAHLEQWGEVPVGFERGPASGRVLSAGDRELTFTTACWTPGTVGAEAGPALIEPLSFEELEGLAGKFAGAWILRNPKVSRRDRGKFDDFYREVGVLGTVRAGTRDGRILTSGSWDIEWDDLPTLVKITVLFDEFTLLTDEIKAAEESGGEPVRLEFNIENQFLHGPIPQYNVVAEIKGSEWPDEFVIVQGHIDAWDGAQGACDNGTGCATTMEVARLIMVAKIKPRRTIRFVLYSGEEQGLHGSKGYVDLHIDELEKTSVVLNHDNGTNYLAGIGPTASMLADFQEVFAPATRLDPTRPFDVHEVESLVPGPSDHAPFISAGVPGFHWDQSKAGYRRLHHTQFDTLEEVNAEDQAHSVLVIATAAIGFANLDHLVDRSFMREPDPRRMGVFLGGEGSHFIDRVTPDSRAAQAGWLAGDEIVLIDGSEMESGRGALVDALQAGEPQKIITIKRGEELIETVLDFTDDPVETERKAWRERQSAREA